MTTAAAAARSPSPPRSRSPLADERAVGAIEPHPEPAPPPRLRRCPGRPARRAARQPPELGRDAAALGQPSAPRANTATSPDRIAASPSSARNNSTSSRPSSARAIIARRGLRDRTVTSRSAPQARCATIVFQVAALSRFARGLVSGRHRRRGAHDLAGARHRAHLVRRAKRGRRARAPSATSRAMGPRRARETGSRTQQSSCAGRGAGRARPPSLGNTQAPPWHDVRTHTCAAQQFIVPQAAPRRRCSRRRAAPRSRRNPTSS